jgi:hypothetical protein
MPIPHTAQTARKSSNPNGSANNRLPSLPSPPSSQPAAPPGRVPGSYNPKPPSKVMALDYANSAAFAHATQTGVPPRAINVPVAGSSHARPLPGAGALNSKPTISGIGKVVVPGDDDFNTALAAEITNPYGYEPTKSKDDAAREMQDLFAGAMTPDDPEAEQIAFDEKEAKVKGLADNITLKAHQVISRKWMREREEGKKAGGILADDMGWVIFSHIVAVVGSAMRPYGVASTVVGDANDVLLQAWKDPPIDSPHRGWTGEGTGTNTVS